jgi:hypothetical protein
MNRLVDRFLEFGERELFGIPNHWNQQSMLRIDRNSQMHMLAGFPVLPMSRSYKSVPASQERPPA